LTRAATACKRSSSGRAGADGGGGGVVAVVALVGDDEHGRVVGGALHVLPRGAALGAAAAVVAARVRGPLDGLLPVLAPRVVVGGDVRRRRHVGPRRSCGRGCRGHAHRAPGQALTAPLLLRAVATPGGRLREVLVLVLVLVRLRLLGSGGGARELALREGRLAGGHGQTAPLGHAPFAAAARGHGRQERGRGTGHGRRRRRRCRLGRRRRRDRDRLGEVQRQGGLLLRRLRLLHRGLERRLRLHRGDGRAAEAGVPRAVQQVDDAAEAGHGLVRDLPERRRLGPLPRSARGRQRRSQQLQAAQPRRGRLLERQLLVRPGPAAAGRHQVHRHGLPLLCSAAAWSWRSDPRGGGGGGAAAAAAFLGCGDCEVGTGGGGGWVL